MLKPMSQVVAEGKKAQPVEKAQPIHPEGELQKEKDLNISSFLLCPPWNLSSENANNPWMTDLPPGERKIDVKKAMNQWCDLYGFLASCATIYLIPPQKGLQDQAYTANLGIVLPHLKDNTVVISNFTSPPRVKEAKEGIDFFTKMNYRVFQSEHKFEGEADLKFIKDSTYVGGFGNRTERETLTWFEKNFDMTVIPVEMKDKYLYHFDCMFLPLNTDNVACVTKLIDPGTLKKIEKVAEVHDVPKDCAYSGLTNSVVFSRTICSHTNIDEMKYSDEYYDDEQDKINCLNKICEKIGFEPVYFDISEFTKSGALMSCLVMHLSYPDFKYPSA
jgi:N-dimethylarginine dimethylaminohydrolase